MPLHEQTVPMIRKFLSHIHFQSGFGLTSIVAVLAANLLITAPLNAKEPGEYDFEYSPDKPWPEQREKIKQAWLGLLGDFPTAIPDLQPETKEVSHEEGITRYHVSFQTEDDDRVTGYLLVPDTAKDQPTPAIICIHSTTWGAGKDSTTGLAGRRPQDPPTDSRTGRAYGLDLARYGYVTLSIDLLTDGERVRPDERILDTRGFYKRNPEWSIVGKNTWDIMRSVDFLHTLDFVDKPHIGIIGWSLGGHTAIIGAAFDPRITACVSNGGVLQWGRKTRAWANIAKSSEPWKKGDEPTNSPEIQRRFGFDEPSNSGPYIYIKNFRQYIDDQSIPLPVRFETIMMMVAPRPLLLISSEQEFYRHNILSTSLDIAKFYSDWEDVEGLPSAFEARQQRSGYEETLEYYQFNYKWPTKKIDDSLRGLGAGDAFTWFSFPGGHSFPPVARRMTFAWFDRWFGFDPPVGAPGTN